MSGWDEKKLTFELTPTKARFYLRRDCSEVPPNENPVTYFLKNAGLKGVRETRYGWVVHATVAQIWFALSGTPSGDEAFRHEGRDVLIKAGLYVEVEGM